MDSEQVRFIREEVKKQLNIILNANTGTTTTQTEDIDNMFGITPSILGRPIMHPFGFVSRAVQGTVSIIARVGADFHNRITLGHKDINRPSDLEEGETCAYSSSGYRIVFKQGMILIGKGDDLEPLVVGTTLNDFLTQFIKLVIAHTHASPGAPPTNVPDFQELETNFLDDNKILTEDGGRF